MNNNASLIWGPIHEYLAGQGPASRRLRLLIAPFVQRDALASLVDHCKDVSALQVVARWTAPDILSGAADLQIYPYLRERHIPLYLHDTIHLKLYVFDNASAFHSSGNITRKGLGLAPAPNIEVGCMVRLRENDWEHILHILQESFRVDDAIYEEAVRFLGAHRREPANVPSLSLRPAIDARFSVLSLPASPSPEHLYTFYKAGDTAQQDKDLSAYVHDLLLYRVPRGLDRDTFFAVLQTQFRAHPFVCAIVALIKEHGSARFGLVNEWLQRECSDRPTPYRWQIKENTRTLYTWLTQFCDAISWDRPNHSMVIRWRTSPQRDRAQGESHG